MKETTIRSRGTTRPCLHQAYVFVLAMLALLALTAGVASAAVPASGTSITNRASATYSVAGVAQTPVQSNLVTTTVQQVASLLLDVTGQSKPVTVGGTVYFQHTVTNTGNGTDNFTLAAGKTGGALSVTNVALLADNGGAPGAALSPVETGNVIAVAPNNTFTFWIAVTVSTGATAGQTATMTVTATSKFDNLKSRTNTDTITVSPYAVVAFTKDAKNDAAPNNNHGKPGDTLTYTISYVNSGTIPSGPLTIQDTIPAGMAYVPGSARWTIPGNANQVLHDNGVGNPANITFSTTGSPVSSLTAVIASVDRSGGADNGTLTFKVTVNNVMPQTISNFAHDSYNDGNGTIVTPADARADFIVDPKYGVALSGVTTTAPPAPNAETGTAAGNTVTQVTDGGTVWFQHQITNNANVADTFLMTAALGSFPAGTTYSFYADNAGVPGAQLTGASSNTTGSVAAFGSTYLVWVKVVLPTGFPTNGGYALTITTTSASSAGATANNTDTVSTVAAYSLTLTGPYNGTAVPGGTKVYTTNVLCNTSNVAVGKTAGDLLIGYTDSNVAQFSSGLYLDATLLTPLTDAHQLNGNTGLTAAGTGATSCGTVYVKVTAFATANGQSNTTTINVTTTKGTGAPKVVVSTTDITNCSTQTALTIEKSQTVDANCNAADLTALPYTLATLGAGSGAVPGTCIAYKLVVTNPGTLDATAVTLTDAMTSPYTVYNKGAKCTDSVTPVGTSGAFGNIDGTNIAAGSITEPAACSPTGSIIFSNLTIPGGKTATTYFRVQITNW